MRFLLSLILLTTSLFATDLAEHYGSIIHSTTLLPEEFAQECSAERSVRNDQGKLVLVDSNVVHHTEWTGAPIKATKGEKYKVVVIVYGKALTADTASILWCTDFFKYSDDNDVQHPMGPVMHLAKAVPGNPIVFRAAGTGIRVQCDTILPYLGMFTQRNMKIDSVRVSVVSGPPLELFRTLGKIIGIALFGFIAVRIFRKK